MRGSRWLIFAPVAILALFAPSANAEPIAGLQTTYYTIDSVPPTRSEHIYAECGSEVENNINRSYDGEPYLDCTNNLFMVHITGFIDVPEHDTIKFWLASDDGGLINIGNNEWGNWGDQGCSATESGEVDLGAGSQPLDLWMYENGGGTCLMLAWNIDNQGWVIVPDEAFTTMSIPADTTIPDTTIQETTTVWTTTTTSTTTTTTTSTSVPFTIAPVTSNLTTTTLQTTTTNPPEPTMPEPPPTTTTNPPEPTMPEPPPTTTTELATLPSEPPILVDLTEPPTELVIAPSLTLPYSLALLLPDSSTLPDVVSEPNDTIAPTETLPFVEPQEFVLPESLEELIVVLDNLESMSNVEVLEVVSAILETVIEPDVAIRLASNSEVLAVVTSSQAEEIFAAIEVSELDQAAIIELVEAVQSAPVEVREAFEETIDVFGAGFDEYVPTGSNVPVSKRRTLIAVMAGVSLTVVNGRAPRRLSTLR